MSDLQDFCERLPEQACIFTCRIGIGQKLNVFFKAVLIPSWQKMTGVDFEDDKKGFKPHPKDTIETFSYNNIQDLCEDCMQSAEDEGLGIEYDTIRFFAYTVDSSIPIRSKVIKKQLAFTGEGMGLQDTKNSIDSLTVALIRMSEECRRTLRTQAEYSEKQLRTIEKLTERNINQEEQRLELERENMIKTIIMEMHDEDNQGDVKERGYELLVKAMDMYKSSQTNSIKQTIRDTILHDEETLKEFMQDDEIKNKIWDTMMKQNEE